ncbi:MAG TPA: lytic transglycosylase domain-containing protein [Patescibacteria group bacterium]|nr:lytic transglycosylase domain-containing protein [Patescibacteria group bacterium]
MADIGRTASFTVAILSALLLSSGGVMAQAMPVIVVPEHASAADPVADVMAEAAQRFGIPATWIQAVMTVESNGDPHALSPKGAMGLMQIMPATWSDLRIRFDLGDDPFDPRANILAGAAYLREMHDRYGASGFLAAYNAGPARYDDYLATGRPLSAETQRYVAMLAPMIGDAQANATANLVGAMLTPRIWTTAPLFVVHTEETDPATPTRRHTVNVSALAPQSNGLFARLADVRHRP